MTIRSIKLVAIGKLVIKLVFVLFFLASLNSINKRVGVFLRARQENIALEEEIGKLETNNIKLEQNIRYATSSAGIRAMVHEYFGLGEIGDRWIKVPDLSKEEDNKDAVVESEANWRLWLRLFTNRI